MSSGLHFTRTGKLESHPFEKEKYGSAICARTDQSNTPLRPRRSLAITCRFLSDERGYQSKFRARTSIKGITGGYVGQCQKGLGLGSSRYGRLRSHGVGQ